MWMRLRSVQQRVGLRPMPIPVVRGALTYIQNWTLGPQHRRRHYVILSHTSFSTLSHTPYAVCAHAHKQIMFNTDIIFPDMTPFGNLLVFTSGFPFQIPGLRLKFLYSISIRPLPLSDEPASIPATPSPAILLFAFFLSFPPSQSAQDALLASALLYPLTAA
jgi:hypothetical protein